MGSPNSDVRTAENNLQLGRNLRWILRVPLTFGIAYKPARSPFARRAYEQDYAESQRRTAEAVRRERRGNWLTLRKCTPKIVFSLPSLMSRVRILPFVLLSVDFPFLHQFQMLMEVWLLCSMWGYRFVLCG